LFDDSGKAVTVDLGEAGPIDAFQLEIQEVVKSLESGTPSPILGGDLACDAVVLCHKQTESVLRGGQPIPVSPADF
jgi:hypothetical protein